MKQSFNSSQIAAQLRQTDSLKTKSLIIMCLGLTLSFSAYADTLLVEAESFNSDYNINGLDYTGNVILYGDGSYDKTNPRDTGWVLDQQFMDQMGSPYLLAHGLGTPVSDAKKIVTFPSAGTYRVWIRTFDWVARWRNEQTRSPKRARGVAPGRFEVLVNSVALTPKKRGYTTELTAFGASGTDWHWQDGGTVKIANPSDVEIRLHDLTGFEGRCDAILFTTDMGFTPPNADPVMNKWRQNLLGTGIPTEKGSYDLVVVGGGLAGMTAALQAARLDLTVAFIQDRPVPGGNNSSETRVHLLGSTNMQPYPRVGDITKEIVQLEDQHYGPGNTARIYADGQNIALLKAQPNISLFFGYRVNEVRTKAKIIESVIAENIQTAERIKFTGKLFLDSTGDAAVGYLAGADYEIRLYDGSNIKTVHMGRSNNWNVKDTRSAVRFPRCPWALNLKGKTILHGNNPSRLGGWQYESGMKRHPINESEYIRDWNFRAMYGTWDSLKNDRRLYPNYQLNYAGYISGKRESRRLMGDHVLTKDDIMNSVVYPDGCFGIKREIDLHFPIAANMKDGFDGDEFTTYASYDKYTGPYWIPYRCLYSRNVGNLFMAGRDASFTNEALGAPRVMKTGGMMGEIVGMAASICKKYDINPRGVYKEHLNDLFALMGRTAVIRKPELEPFGTNYALSATVSASGEYNGTYVAGNVNNGSSNPKVNTDRWLSTAGVPNWVELKFSKPRYISACRIVSGYFVNGSTDDPIQDFVLQYRNASGWVDIPKTKTAFNTKIEWTADFPAVKSDRFRLYITSTKIGISRIFEVELYHPDEDL